MAMVLTAYFGAAAWRASAVCWTPPGTYGRQESCGSTQLGDATTRDY